MGGAICCPIDHRGVSYETLYEHYIKNYGGATDMSPESAEDILANPKFFWGRPKGMAQIFVYNMHAPAAVQIGKASVAFFGDGTIHHLNVQHKSWTHTNAAGKVSVLAEWRVVDKRGHEDRDHFAFGSLAALVEAWKATSIWKPQSEGMNRGTGAIAAVVPTSSTGRGRVSRSAAVFV